VRIRPADDADLPAVAALHATRIDEGFLSSLGPAFLRRLYRRVRLDDRGFVLVATDDDDVVTGFAAGVADLKALYRRFVLRDGLVAGLRSAPRLVRALPRVVETLRYADTGADLPTAEILAVAVARSAGGRGVGRSLVGAAVAEFDRLAVAAAKVVTTADNEAAIAMYRAAGFLPAATIEVHQGRTSQVLVWTPPSR
jgi:ribosomal protein S18 acetylase RimI-like enzyme